jgi:predicted DNA-binding transcriptional regulator YafY
VPVASHESAIRELLRFGPDVEIIAPDRLRTRITEILNATIGKYHGPEPGETRRHSPG